MSIRAGHRVPHPVFNTSKDGDSSTSLGSPVQCQITHSVQKCLLRTNLNLPWCLLRLSSGPGPPWERSPTPAGSRLCQGFVESVPVARQCWDRGTTPHTLDSQALLSSTQVPGDQEDGAGENQCSPTSALLQAIVSGYLWQPWMSEGHHLTAYSSDPGGRHDGPQRPKGIARNRAALCSISAFLQQLSCGPFHLPPDQGRSALKDL
ncbi:uncharacterized protein LOC134552307 [Prinia subflava]|uniref:uncharacterized protein LOC134552307 n=1 Tax=Prinia subflava TaxID=208062 RepID=UPI002FDF92CA